MKSEKHLVFYDGKCGFCDFCVRFVLQRDRQNRFVFAPLEGKTAQQFLHENQSAQKVDSLIMVENFQSSTPSVLYLGKAALRIAWYLGGAWPLVGIFSFLPSFLYDWAYRLVASNRSSILSDQACMLPKQKDKKKFLP